jgi:hypothetical protein
MDKKARASSGRCLSCSKALEDMTCPSCKGRGYLRNQILVRRKCLACQGAGRVMRCPDESKHTAGLVRSLPRISSARPYESLRGGKPTPVRTPEKEIGFPIGHPSNPDPMKRNTQHRNKR